MKSGYVPAAAGDGAAGLSKPVADVNVNSETFAEPSLPTYTK